MIVAMHVAQAVDGFILAAHTLFAFEYIKTYSVYYFISFFAWL